MNPAVSLAMVILGKLKIWKFPFYVIAQFLGAFAGAAAVFGLYYGEHTFIPIHMHIKQLVMISKSLVSPKLEKEPTLSEMGVSSLSCHSKNISATCSSI